VVVTIHVKTESIQAFREASVVNAKASLEEPGVIRHDIVQQADDPTRFLLVEVFRSRQDGLAHKETAHFHAWEARVNDMMAEPRKATVYNLVWPSDASK